MMRTLTQWIECHRRHSPRRAAGGSVAVRRLAIEAMEDRLLLSTAPGTKAYDGGSVAFDILASGLRPGSARLVELDGRPAIVFNCDGRLVVSGQLDGSLAENASVLTGGLAGELDARAAIPARQSEAGSDLARPDQFQFALGDFGPEAADGGMVDVARIAREKVFADTTRIAEASLEGNSLARSEARRIAADAFHAEESGRVVPARLKSAISESIHGSRGRLAAFDLALRHEATFQPPRWFEESHRSPEQTDSAPVDQAARPEGAVAVATVDPMRIWDAVGRFGLVKDAPSEGSHSNARSPDLGVDATGDEPSPALTPVVVEHEVAVSKESAGERETSQPAVSPRRHPAEMASLVVLAGIGYHLVSEAGAADGVSRRLQLPLRRRRVR